MSKDVYTPIIDGVVARLSDGIHISKAAATWHGTTSSRWWIGWHWNGQCERCR